MKKTLFSLALLCLVSLPGLSVGEEIYSNPAGNPVDQFTGKYWLDSKPENQKAFLFGIDSAIAVEASIHNHQVTAKAKSGKKPVYTLSPFEQGWMEAFKDTSRDQIVEQVDQWYKDHPTQLDRPVLDVIWYELVMPRLNAKK